VPLIIGFNAGEYSFFRKLAPMSTPKTYERLLVRVASAIGDQPTKLMLVDAAADGDSTPLKERANAAGEELLALLYIDEMVCLFCLSCFHFCLFIYFIFFFFFS